MTMSPMSWPYVSLTRLNQSMSVTTTESLRAKRVARVMLSAAAASMARLFDRPVMPSVVAMVSSFCTMRALASDTARWLDSTSSMLRVESVNACLRRAPSTNVPRI